MERSRAWIVAVAVGLAMASLGASPMASTYLEVQRRIQSIRDAWSQAGAPAQPNAPGWNTFFDALNGELDHYSRARTEDDRLRALDRLYQMSVALREVSWPAAQQVREELRAWLRPRVRLAWAEQRLLQAVNGLPRTPAPAVQQNRQNWVRFVDDGLGKALRDYDAARTALQRQAALKRVYGALNQLRAGNQTRPWSPALALEVALNDLFNVPNFDLTADVAAVRPALDNPVATTGPIFFKGHWSYVTAGPKTGFGLLNSDDGIAFYNSQMMTSVTPIHDFEQQMAQDRRGRRATRLYHFGATSVDQSELTITAMLRADGLHLAPTYKHLIGATINTNPTDRNGLGRFVASLVGFNQQRITQMVYDQAMPQIVQGVIEGANELGSIKISEAAAQKNAQIHRSLVGNNQLVYRNITVQGLSLGSRPELVMVGGTVTWTNAKEQVGADRPQPAKFQAFQPGVAVDVHLPSLMTNMARGYVQSDAVQKVQNLMVVTRKIPPGAPPRQGIATTANVDFETFRKAVETARAANDPKVLAIRVKRPGESPEFTADAAGRLVALVHDFALEVPAPPEAKRGGMMGPPADIYMLSAPAAEFAISFKLTPARGSVPVHLSGRIEEFDPGPNARVFAVTNEEKKAVPLTTFASAIVMRVFGAKLRGQPVDIPLSRINLRGYALSSVSALDPSGWMRLVLTPTGERPPVAQPPPEATTPQPAATAAVVPQPGGPAVQVAGQP